MRYAGLMSTAVMVAVAWGSVLWGRRLVELVSEGEWVAIAFIVSLIVLSITAMFLILALIADFVCDALERAAKRDGQ